MSEEIVPYMRRLPGRVRPLVTCLRDLGYTFDHSDDVLPGPARDIDQQIQHLERMIGPVPLALAEFYRTVGSIDLTGSHAEWSGCEYPDPLVIFPIEAALEEAQQYMELEDPKSEYWASDSRVFRAPLAPDAKHKANVSGGMWYGIEIPNSAPDPIVLGESHGLPLTRYLEFCLSWGGFPGLANAAA